MYHPLSPHIVFVSILWSSIFRIKPEATDKNMFNVGFIAYNIMQIKKSDKITFINNKNRLGKCVITIHEPNLNHAVIRLHHYSSNAIILPIYLSGVNLL